jgi:hypothetical protein
LLFPSIFIAGLEHDFGCSAASAAEICGLMAQHKGIFFEQTLDDPTKRACPFTVDNPDMINTSPLAFFKVFGDKVLDIFGPERMEIQHAVDRNSDRLVGDHRFLLISFYWKTSGETTRLIQK